MCWSGDSCEGDLALPPGPECTDSRRGGAWVDRKKRFGPQIWDSGLREAPGHRTWLARGGDAE